MRARFILGFVGEREDQPYPADAVDFIKDWNARPPRDGRRTGVGRLVVFKIKFCPFCGQPLAPDAPTTTKKGLL